jgi:photosystem II stability/assembly factor-like uncharacterized protein
MANDLGTGVSYVYENEGYGYDMLVFQKAKPPLDSELNLEQDLINGARARQMVLWPSGWASFYPIHTDRSLSNGFYTQDPTAAKPEYAVVNGNVIHFTGTNSQADNVNLLDLGLPPDTGNVVDGVVLESWRALISPSSNANKPASASVVDSLNSVFTFDGTYNWICGDNGLILGTTNGGQSWLVQPIDTKRDLNGIFFATGVIGWVVGSNGMIARTSSAGNRWTLLNTGVSENLNSVYAANQLIAWVVGASGTILKTVNGINWTPLVSGVTADLNKIHFRDQLVGWAVGANGTIIKTTNGGLSWVLQTSGTTQNLNSIYFYDLNYGFAVGDNGTILQTSNGGACWVSQSGNIFTTFYTTTPEHLKDITMVPTLDRVETDEEVSSQLGVAGRSFTVSHKPITKGDGNGTITNNPADIISVKVNNVSVLVDSVNGITGAVVLNVAPGPNAVTKVSYYYKDDTAVFEGKAWIVGTKGSIFSTQTIGAQWLPQTFGTADLLSVDFINQNTGWVSGTSSTIKKTIDGGVTWSSQQSDQFAREVQRVFLEGNIETQTFLTDNSIHPDANIETTKRVQLQYKVRVISGADPNSNPEAGLSTGILGQGPNLSGIYPYENMGPINGDYGCWRARCSNTVDGYVYAIPMFFVNRRNVAAYNPQTNPNGSHIKNTSAVRPDFLTATDVVDSDILDVRRRIVIPAASKLMTTHFDDLMANSLKTNFFRSSVGGDRYGIELLQTDRVGGTDSNGGTKIPDISMNQVLLEGLSSEVISFIASGDTTASTVVPLQRVLSAPTNGIFDSQTSHYKAVYVTGDTTSSYSGKSVPGSFYGQGTDSVVFVFESSAATTYQEPTLTSYHITASGVEPSYTALTYVPSDPKLVKNFSGAGSPGFYYQGVLGTTDAKVIETWASLGAVGYTDYALAYQSKEATDVDQQYRASSVEVHHFMKVVNSGASSTLSIDQSSFKPDSEDTATYTIYTIKKINNITSGFSYKLTNMVVGSLIVVTAETGYEFVNGAVVEVIGMVLSDKGDTNIRNGATVNFDPFLKKISRFSKSITKTVLPSSTTFSVYVPNTEILGCSSTETSSSLNQPICWAYSGDMHKVSVTGFGTDTITITDPGWVSDIITVQLLVKQDELDYMDDAVANDGLLISYNYIPPQCQSNLPTTLTVSSIVVSPVIYVSNLGSGGGISGEPYLTPLQHIPIKNTTIVGDTIFSNLSSLQFSNFTIDTGFAQVPVNIPGSFSGTITFSETAVDRVFRTFYSVASKESIFSCEGLQFAVPRKIFLPIIAQVDDPTNRIFMQGEYLLVIFSRAVISESENITGYFSNGDCSISIYRLPNRPISRVL